MTAPSEPVAVSHQARPAPAASRSRLGAILDLVPLGLAIVAEAAWIAVAGGLIAEFTLQEPSLSIGALALFVLVGRPRRPLPRAGGRRPLAEHRPVPRRAWRPRRLAVVAGGDGDAPGAGRLPGPRGERRGLGRRARGPPRLRPRKAAGLGGHALDGVRRRRAVPRARGPRRRDDRRAAPGPVPRRRDDRGRRLRRDGRHRARDRPAQRRGSRLGVRLATQPDVGRPARRPRADDARGRGPLLDRVAADRLVAGSAVGPLLVIGLVLGFNKRALRTIALVVAGVVLLFGLIRLLSSSGTALKISLGGATGGEPAPTDPGPVVQVGLLVVVVVAMILVLVLARIWSRRSGPTIDDLDEVRLIDRGDEGDALRPPRWRLGLRSGPEPRDAVDAYLRLLRDLRVAPDGPAGARRDARRARRTPQDEGRRGPVAGPPRGRLRAGQVRRHRAVRCGGAARRRAMAATPADSGIRVATAIVGGAGRLSLGRAAVAADQPAGRFRRVTYRFPPCSPSDA